MLIVLLPENLQPEQPETTVMTWWRLDRDGRPVEQGENSLDELKSRFSGEKMRALVPPSAVTLYRVSIPVRRAAAVRAALPFALEDKMSQELEELHFVPGPRRADDSFAAAVVEQENMQLWQAMFLEAGWRLEALIPLASLHAEDVPADVMRVYPSPWPSAAPLVVVTSADQEPAIVESGLLAFWLSRRLAERSVEDRQLEVVGLDPARLGIDQSVVVETLQGESDKGLGALLTRAAMLRPQMNLLSGPYSNGMATPPWRRMRPALIAAGVLLAILTAQFAAEHIILSNERDRLYAEIDRVFDTSMPNARRVDPVTQFRQALEGGGASANGRQGMGPLLHDVLAIARQGEDNRIRQFRASPAEVEIELQLESFADLEALRARLVEKEGLRESLQGADSGTEGVTARLKVERSGS